MPGNEKHPISPLPYTVVAIAVTLAVYSALSGDTFATSLSATSAAMVVALGFCIPFAANPSDSRWPRLRSDDAPRLERVPRTVAWAPAIIIGIAVIVGAASWAAYSAAPEAAVGTRLPLRFEGPAAAVMLVAYYLCTGFFEEALFRVASLRGFAAAFRERGASNAPFLAALLSSALFALLHAAGPSAGDAQQMAQLLLKAAAAFLFGLTLCAVYARSGSLAEIGLLHAAYDVASNIAVDLASGGVAAAYATGLPADTAVYALACALLVAPGVQSGRALAGQSRIL